MKKKKLLLIVSILVVIALVGTGFYLVENPDRRQIRAS